jgi:murein DD-endopeptidase MepM/ murein hydrolase activator NlpD
LSGVRFDVLQDLAAPERDLASVLLWEKSLYRSRQRRRLEEIGRKSRRRRKGAALATTTALAAVPVLPQTLAAAEGPGSNASVAGAANHDPVLSAAGQRAVLREGSTGPLVAAAQRRLNEVLPVTHISEDGIFGPQTRGAVVQFQRSKGLTASGTIDTRTWAMMFQAPVLVFGGASAGGTAAGGDTGNTGSAPASVNHTSNAGSGRPSAKAGAAGGGSKPSGISTSKQSRKPATGLGGGALEGSSNAGTASDTSGSSNDSGPSSGSAPSNPAPNESSGAGHGSSGHPKGSTGTSPVAVVAPSSPPPQTSTYVLTNGVALPLPRQYVAGGGSVDQGVDYAAPGGTPEYAMGDGVIIGAGISGFGPNAPILKITSGPLKGAEIYYGHAGPNLVRVGQHVHAGQQITIVGYGIVGISTGPHLEVGFYPPGPMGAGSRMLSVINSMLAQHSSGRAWGTGGQVLARTTRQRAKVAHASRRRGKTTHHSKKRRRVVHHSQRQWGTGGLTVVTSTGAAISTAPASPAVTSTGGGVVTSTAPPVVTVTPPPDTTSTAPATESSAPESESSAPAVASSAPVAAENTSSSETAAPSATTATDPAAGTVQSGSGVDGAQAAPTATSSSAAAPVDGPSASTGDAQASDSGATSGGGVSQTPAGSSGAATTTATAAAPPASAGGPPPASEAGPQASSSQPQQEAGPPPANADPAAAPAESAGSASSTGATTSTATTSAATVPSHTGAGAGASESGAAHGAAGSAK